MASSQKPLAKEHLMMIKLRRELVSQYLGYLCAKEASREQFNFFPIQVLILDFSKENDYSTLPLIFIIPIPLQPDVLSL